MIKLIASDMDGTLLNEKMQISAENIKTIKYAQKKGVEFLIATGRSKLESAKLLANAGIKVGYINLNGAMLYNTEGHLVFEQDIPTEKSKEIIKILNESGYYFEIVSADNVYSNSKLERITNVSNLLVDLNQNLDFKHAVPLSSGSEQIMGISFVDNYSNLLNLPNFKVMKFLAFKPDGATFDQVSKKLLQLGDLVITSSSNTNIEINHKNAQKGIALMHYAKMKGISTNQVMAIGDNLNDKSMIERAGVSVAMGNAVDEIKALAKHITLKNTEDGVAHAIYEFLGDN